MLTLTFLTFHALSVPFLCVSVLVDEPEDAYDDDVAKLSLQLLQKSHKQSRNARRECSEHLPMSAPKLHFLSMGRSGSCFWGELFGDKGGRPYVFEPFNENGWGLWNSDFAPFNPESINGWGTLTEEAEAQNVRRLNCIYGCENCEDEVALDHSELIENFCREPAEVDKVVVKTVAINDAATFLKLPPETLCGSKFVLMLRDPRGISNSRACQRMFSLAMSIKELTAAVGKENVRTLFYEDWSRDVETFVQDVANWANMTVTPTMREAIEEQAGDPATKWMDQGETAFINGEQSWCKEFYELVGYPTREEIMSPDLQATGCDELQPSCVDYSRLKDPTLTPITEEQQELLYRFRGSADGYAWLQTKASSNVTTPAWLHFHPNLQS